MATVVALPILVHDLVDQIPVLTLKLSTLSTISSYTEIVVNIVYAINLDI